MKYTEEEYDELDLDIDEEEEEKPPRKSKWKKRLINFAIFIAILLAIFIWCRVRAEYMMDNFASYATGKSNDTFHGAVLHGSAFADAAIVTYNDEIEGCTNFSVINIKYRASDTGEQTSGIMYVIRFEDSGSASAYYGSLEKDETQKTMLLKKYLIITPSDYVWSMDSLAIINCYGFTHFI